MGVFRVKGSRGTCGTCWGPEGRRKYVCGHDSDRCGAFIDVVVTEGLPAPLPGTRGHCQRDISWLSDDRSVS